LQLEPRGIRIIYDINVLIGIGVIIFDLAVYEFLGLLFMNYDYFYDEIKVNIGV